MWERIDRSTNVIPSITMQQLNCNCISIITPEADRTRVTWGVHHFEASYDYFCFLQQQNSEERESQTKKNAIMAQLVITNCEGLYLCQGRRHPRHGWNNNMVKSHWWFWKRLKGATITNVPFQPWTLPSASTEESNPGLLLAQGSLLWASAPK